MGCIAFSFHFSNSSSIRVFSFSSINSFDGNSLGRTQQQQQHLQGPVDGSLYATILKSPKPNSNPPCVILSPPAEFRESSLSPYNTKSQRLSGSTQSLQVHPTTSSAHHERQRLSPTPSSTTTSTLRNHRSRDYSPSLASTVAESVHFQRAFSTPPQENHNRYVAINHRDTTNAINQQQQHHYQSHQQLHRPSHHPPQQFVREIRIVEECKARGGGGGGVKSANAKLGGNARDSLTASSMDSGISSSGLQQRQQMQVHNNNSK